MSELGYAGCPGWYGPRFVIVPPILPPGIEPGVRARKARVLSSYTKGALVQSFCRWTAKIAHLLCLRDSKGPTGFEPAILRLKAACLSS